MGWGEELSSGAMFKAEGVVSSGPFLDQLLGSLGLGRTHFAAAGLSPDSTLCSQHAGE